jgi:phosphopantothenate-cysteine ligase
MDVNEETSFSAESYFETQPPPAGIDEAIQEVNEFIDYHKASGRKIVLITVGVLSFNRPLFLISVNT